MSTLTIFARGDRALVLTDTAGTDPDLRVSGWASKVVTIPHLKVALAAQGAAEALGTLANRLAYAFASFDTMISHGGPVLAEAHEDHSPWWEASAHAQELRLGLTGWSEKQQRFEAYFLQSREWQGIPAFEFTKRDLVMAPDIHPEDLQKIRIPSNGAAFSADAQAYLLRILTFQRHFTTPRPDGLGEPGHITGGQVVATEMTRAGITQQVIHSWPDKLGEPIRPASFLEELGAVLRTEQPASAPNVISMSRQQRRAAERAS